MNETRILIEKYRNFEIYFDRNDETFYCVSDYYDTDQKKKSYASAKKAIDEYIKENTTFRPFYVHNCRSKSRGEQFPTHSDDNKILVTGIRRDGRFVSGDKQISEYDESNVYLAVPENEEVYKEFAPFLQERKRLEQLRSAKEKNITTLRDKLTLISLKDHRKTLRGEKS
jgi:hypothetical protein